MNDAPLVNPDEAVSRVTPLGPLGMMVGIVGVLTFFMLVPAVMAIVLSLLAGAHINVARGRRGGAGYAHAGLLLGMCGVLLFCVAELTRPRHVLSERSRCGANVRGIMQSMNVYVADNGDTYPLITYAPYTPALNKPAASAVAITVDETINAYFRSPHPQAGSPAASAWLLVLKNYTSPRQFICRDDPFADQSAAAQLQSENRFFDNFQSPTQLSYSFAYPWMADGAVGNWWKNTEDSSLPIMADMAPENGTGVPVRTLAAASAPTNMHAWNSANHGGDGQNIGFADGHAEFSRRPDIGQHNDNIWTSSGTPSTGTTESGGVPAGKYSPALMGKSAPFDVVMYPIRNAATGEM